MDGNGQRELADVVAGMRVASEGKVMLLGQDCTHDLVEKNESKWVWVMFRKTV